MPRGAWTAAAAESRWSEYRGRNYAWFLAARGKRLPWHQVAEAFRTSWNSVYRAVTIAVMWGVANRSLDDVKAIGIDEVRATISSRMAGQLTRSTF